MKKYLSILLAIAFLFVACMPVFAAAINMNDAEQSASPDIFTKTTRKDNTDAASYSVTIPANTEIQWGATKTEFKYNITSQLEIGKRLNVTVIGKNNEDKMINAETTATIPYAFSYTNMGGSVENLDYTTENEIVNINRTFNIEIQTDDWNAVPIARYEDCLTFTVEIVNA